MAFSESYRVKLYGQSEGLVVACLLTIEHPTAGTLKLSTDPTELVQVDGGYYYRTLSRGEEYRFIPVEVILPVDEGNSEPAGRLSIANADRLLIPLLRTVPDGVSAKIEIIEPSDDPDSVQREFGNLQIINATYDAQEVVLSMRVDMLQDEPYPYGRFTPGGFPFAF